MFLFRLTDEGENWTSGQEEEIQPKNDSKTLTQSKHQSEKEKNLSPTEERENSENKDDDVHSTRRRVPPEVDEDSIALSEGVYDRGVPLSHDNTCSDEETKEQERELELARGSRIDSGDESDGESKMDAQSGPERLRSECAVYPGEEIPENSSETSDIPQHDGPQVLDDKDGEPKSTDENGNVEKTPEEDEEETDNPFDRDSPESPDEIYIYNTDYMSMSDGEEAMTPSEDVQNVEGDDQEMEADEGEANPNAGSDMDAEVVESKEEAHDSQQELNTHPPQVEGIPRNPNLPSEGMWIT